LWEMYERFKSERAQEARRPPQCLQTIHPAPRHPFPSPLDGRSSRSNSGRPSKRI
jgi:hypothetical protein